MLMEDWLVKSERSSRRKLFEDFKMNSSQLLQLLESVAEGSQSPDSALEKLRTFQVENLGFAEVDHHRQLRNGFSEVVYCEGKTPEQVAELFTSLNRETPNASLLGLGQTMHITKLSKKVSRAATIVKPQGVFISTKLRRTNSRVTSCWSVQEPLIVQSYKKPLTQPDSLEAELR